MRELGKLQSHYRELIADYVKTLEVKLRGEWQDEKREKFVAGMATKDELIRN